MKNIVPNNIGEAIFTIKKYCESFQDCEGCPLYSTKHNECFFESGTPYDSWFNLKREVLYLLGDDSKDE